jgi:hypothetical protein
LDKDCFDNAGDWRGNLGIDLVSRDFHEGLVDLNAVTNVLEPTGDSTLGNAFAECGEADGLAHELNLLVSVNAVVIFK